MRSNPNAYTKNQKDDATDIVGDVSHIYNQITHGYVTAIDIRDYITLVQDKLSALYDSLETHLINNSHETQLPDQSTPRTLNSIR